jgi:cytosine/adenosine deaminase-related metal-dependent hydrolase
MSSKPIHWRNLKTPRAMYSTRRLMKTLSDKVFSRHGVYLLFHVHEKETKEKKEKKIMC